MENITRTTLSSNTLFNFTDKAEYFNQKLENGFAPRYCLEDVSKFFNSKQSKAFPMVCFCDIPVSHMKDHIWNYGKFGIGLTKEWGIRNNVHPVLYYPKESSPIAELLLSLRKSIGDIEKAGMNFNEAVQEQVNEVLVKLKNDHAHLVRYLKLYEGMQGGRKFRFYDEKEWRYLPSTGSKGFFMDEQEFSNAVIREKRNRELELQSIDFEANDVKFLVVPGENDVKDLLILLDNLVEMKRFTSLDKTYLVRKIITVDEIMQDF